MNLQQFYNENPCNNIAAINQFFNNCNTFNTVSGVTRVTGRDRAHRGCGAGRSGRARKPSIINQARLSNRAIVASRTSRDNQPANLQISY